MGKNGKRKLIPTLWKGRLLAKAAKVIGKCNMKLTPQELAWLNRHRRNKPVSNEAWIADLKGDVRLRKYLNRARKSGEIATWSTVASASMPILLCEPQVATTRAIAEKSSTSASIRSWRRVISSPDTLPNGWGESGAS